MGTNSGGDDANYPNADDFITKNSETRFLAGTLWAGFALLLIIKLFFAARLDLYSDEIFYWLASTRPALAYSDLPFMTALLIGLGSALDPGNTLAARFLFILLGSSIPLLVYWIALPVTDRRQALESALLTLCIPLGGFLGLLAVPDVPLLFFGLLAIGFFERALRTNRLLLWLGTGTVVALGLCTHYRFILFPAAAGLFLLVHQPERRQWTNIRFWMAVGIGALGLIPIIWFNLSNQLASVSFYLVERHPWEFQSIGLLHVFKQAGVVTPTLYALFGLVFWQLLVKAKKGERDATLYVCFASIPLMVYLFLAPWTDSNSTSLHWPLAGYFPLLVFAPSGLRTVYAWSKQRWRDAVARKIVIAVPSLGFAGSIVAMSLVGSQAYQMPLQSLLGKGVLSNKMAGWQEFSQFTEELLATNFVDESPVFITDNYYTAAQVEFAGLTDNAFTLDNDKAVRDGRITQLRLWGKDASGLRQFTDRPVLFVSEDSTLTIPDKEVVMAQICHYVDNLEHLATQSIFNAEKEFRYYGNGRIIANNDANYRATPCPFPVRAWIDIPVEDAVMSGIFHIDGWAYNEDIGIDTVSLLIDGQLVAELPYGINRPDVVEVMGVVSDPNRPNLGYSYELDTRQFANGAHLLAIRLIDSKGVATDYGERKIRVAN